MSDITNEKKWMISLLSAIIFIIIASPTMFSFTNKVFKSFNIDILDEEENVTWTGLIIHGVVYMLISRLLMNYNVEDNLLETFNLAPKKVQDGSFSIRRHM